MAEESPRPASSRIFISYRREDALPHVNALFGPLRSRFGVDRIFKDTDNIAPGQDFLKVIQSQLNSCSVLLAVIGTQWLTVLKPKSNLRRLDDPNDYLRMELATALKNENIRVIPILVGQGTMPAAEDLPSDLTELSRRNEFELRDSRWEWDVKLLIEKIEEACGAPASVGPHVPPPAPLFPAPAVVDVRIDEFDRMELRRKQQIAEHVTVARQKFEARDYEAVLTACERIVWLDARHGEALDLARRARVALDEQRVQDWLGRAHQVLTGDELTDTGLSAASELIDQALSLNANHEAALKLRHEVLALRKRRERQREVARYVRAALVRAQASFDEEDFDAAIEHCEDLLALYGESADAQGLRSKAVAAKHEQRQQREVKRRAQQVVKEARTECAAGPAAVETPEQVLTIDPTIGDAQHLKDRPFFPFTRRSVLSMGITAVVAALGFVLWASIPVDRSVADGRDKPTVGPTTGVPSGVAVPEDATVSRSTSSSDNTTIPARPATTASSSTGTTPAPAANSVRVTPETSAAQPKSGTTQPSIATPAASSPSSAPPTSSNRPESMAADNLAVKPPAQQKTDRIAVFVTSVGALKGFTDPSKENRDSVKDLRDDLKDKKNLVLVETREAARIVLVVMGREKAQVTVGLFGDPARDVILRVQFIAGKMETELTASAQGGTLSSGGAWGRAAGKIADQVDDWAKENRTRLN